MIAPPVVLLSPGELVVLAGPELVELLDPAALVSLVESEAVLSLVWPLEAESRSTLELLTPVVVPTVDETSGEPDEHAPRPSSTAQVQCDRFIEAERTPESRQGGELRPTQSRGDGAAV